MRKGVDAWLISYSENSAIRNILEMTWGAGHNYAIFKGRMVETQ